MQLGKIKLADGSIRAAIVEGEMAKLFRAAVRLCDVLHHAQPARAAQEALDAGPAVPLAEVRLLAPVDDQEVWAAGVTYKRSEEARKRESVGAAQFYDLVYSAERPEIFFKAPARRVRHPGDPVGIRRDSHWTVPEPELALVLDPQLRIVGFTIGNDMSARDIEGENPLYLPQAKMYDGACALGPVVTLAEAMPPLQEITIRLCITRAGNLVFDGATKASQMARSFAQLTQWLGRETTFPDGAILLTGTGIVPPDSFHLQDGDQIDIEISEIGTLTNYGCVK